jgi:hypothetical protein
MNSLILGLALSTPAQPPILDHTTVLPPRVQAFPHARPAVPVSRPTFPVYQPAPIFQPAPVIPVPTVLTIAQFSRVFVPAPGRHSYLLLHPRTGQPVHVCFTLPNCGRLDRLEVGRDWIEIELDRPDFEVEINFRKNGRVEIEYDD